MAAAEEPDAVEETPLTDEEYEKQMDLEYEASTMLVL
jgi:hypothetical protein